MKRLLGSYSTGLMRVLNSMFSHVVIPQQSLTVLFLDWKYIFSPFFFFFCSPYFCAPQPSQQLSMDLVLSPHTGRWESTGLFCEGSEHSGKEGGFCVPVHVLLFCFLIGESGTHLSTWEAGTLAGRKAGQELKVERGWGVGEKSTLNRMETVPSSLSAPGWDAGCTRHLCFDLSCPLAKTKLPRVGWKVKRRGQRCDVAANHLESDSEGLSQGPRSYVSNYLTSDANPGPGTTPQVARVWRTGRGKWTTAGNSSLLSLNTVPTGPNGGKRSLFSGFLRPIEKAPWVTGLPRSLEAPDLCCTWVYLALTGTNVFMEKREAGKCQEEGNARKTTFLLL